MNKKSKYHATGGPWARVLSPDEAKDLAAKGWARADLHVHTLHSYDVIPTLMVHPLALYHKARRLGMTYVAFTDHDSMAAYDQIGWTREGLVPAVEVKILDPKNVGHTIHINVYGLDRHQFYRILKIARLARDIERLVAYLKDERLPFTFNHPFWHEPGEEPNLQAVIDVSELFPVLEYNMGRIGQLNGEALRLAHAKQKGIVASTDTHIGEIGRAFTLARGATFKEFFDQIQKGQALICPADLTISSLKNETAIRIENLFNKTAWLFPKKSYSMDTGNALLDTIIKHVAQVQPGDIQFSGKVFKKILQAVSHSGIPGSLYIRAQRNRQTLGRRGNRCLDFQGNSVLGPRGFRLGWRDLPGNS